MGTAWNTYWRFSTRARSRQLIIFSPFFFFLSFSQTDTPLDTSLAKYRNYLPSYNGRDDFQPSPFPAIINHSSFGGRWLDDVENFCLRNWSGDRRSGAVVPEFHRVLPRNFLFRGQSFDCWSERRRYRSSITSTPRTPPGLKETSD